MLALVDVGGHDINFGGPPPGERAGIGALVEDVSDSDAVPAGGRAERGDGNDIAIGIGSPAGPRKLLRGLEIGAGSGFGMRKGVDLEARAGLSKVDVIDGIDPGTRGKRLHADGPCREGIGGLVIELWAVWVKGARWRKGVVEGLGVLLCVVRTWEARVRQALWQGLGVRVVALAGELGDAVMRAGKTEGRRGRELAKRVVIGMVRE